MSDFSRMSETKKNTLKPKRKTVKTICRLQKTPEECEYPCSFVHKKLKDRLGYCSFRFNRVHKKVNRRTRKALKKELDSLKKTTKEAIQKSTEVKEKSGSFLKMLGSLVPDMSMSTKPTNKEPMENQNVEEVSKSAEEEKEVKPVEEVKPAEEVPPPAEEVKPVEEVKTEEEVKPAVEETKPEAAEEAKPTEDLTKTITEGLNSLNPFSTEKKEEQKPVVELQNPAV
jgi:chemotaxis protein histidine kinase CheA